MLNAANCAMELEKATEASLTVIFQLVALSSGVIGDDDYLIDYEGVSGKQIRYINQRKIVVHTSKISDYI